MRGIREYFTIITRISITVLKRNETYRLLIRFKNSSLVFAFDRMQPSMQLVVVVAVVFWTPLMTMQKWADSTTTATPWGWSISESARATCFVRRSCTWRRRANISAMRASFDRPMTRRLGMYPMCIYGESDQLTEFLSGDW